MDSFDPAIVVFVSYQIILRCWELEPADRPTFTVLKATMDDFMHEDHSSIIHFPNPEMAYNSSNSASSGYHSASPFNESIPGYDALAPAEEVFYDEEPYTADRQEFLVVRNRVRRHASEPGFEERDEGVELELNGGSGSNIRPRSHSNPYVHTPRRDSKFNTRKSFEWMIDMPQIRIQPICEI